MAVIQPHNLIERPPGATAPEGVGSDPLTTMREFNEQLRQELIETRNFMRHWAESNSQWLVEHGQLLARLNAAEEKLAELRQQQGALARGEDLERVSRNLSALQQREVGQALELRRQVEQSRAEWTDTFATEHAALDAAAQAMRAEAAEALRRHEALHAAHVETSTRLEASLSGLVTGLCERQDQLDRAMRNLVAHMEVHRDLMAGYTHDLRIEVTAGYEKAVARIRAELQANISKVNERVTHVDRAQQQNSKALRDRIATLDRDNGRAHALFRQNFQNIFNDPAFHRLVRLGWLGQKVLGLFGLDRKLRKLPPPAAAAPAAAPPAPAPAKPAAAPVPKAAPAAAPAKPAAYVPIQIPELGRFEVPDEHFAEAPQQFARGFCSLTHVYRPLAAAPPEMRVVLDVARVFDPQLTGVGHYCEQLARALLRRPELDLALYSSELLPAWILNQPGAQKFLHCPPQARVGELEQLHRAPLLEDLAGPHDIYLHTSAIFKPLLRTACKLSVVYDIAPISVPETVPAEATAICQAYTRYLAATSWHFIADSAYTKKELVEYAQIEPDKIDVIHVGLDPLFRRPPAEADLERVAAKYGLNEPFMLCVGTLQPRKNLLRLLEAYALLHARGRALPRLVLTGSNLWSKIAGFSDQLERFQAENRLQWLGYVDRVDMPALYKLSRLFVYPSYFEGYGMPVAEAMASGAAVACGNRTSLPEVAGEAACYFDPLQTEAIAEALDGLIDDDSALEALRVKSLEQSLTYPTWDRVAEEFLTVMRRMRRDG